MNYYEFASRLFEYLSNNDGYIDVALYYKRDYYFKVCVREKYNTNNSTNRKCCKVFEDHVTSMDYQKESEDLEMFWLYNNYIE